MIYAVIDTNVLISALLTKNMDAPTLKVYEVAMEKREDDSYLVTGNQRHYPIKDFIVTPAEMMAIIDATE